MNILSFTGSCYCAGNPGTQKADTPWSTPSCVSSFCCTFHDERTSCVCCCSAIQVSDCARHPAFIDEDSVWFRQDCFDCEERSTIGKVGGKDTDDRKGEIETADREREKERDLRAPKHSRSCLTQIHYEGVCWLENVEHAFVLRPTQTLKTPNLTGTLTCQNPCILRRREYILRCLAWQSVENAIFPFVDASARDRDVISPYPHLPTPVRLLLL